MTQQFIYNKPFKLESGLVLPGFHLAYTTLGKPDTNANSVIWIFHALTANSNPQEWWPGLVGKGRLFDPQRHFIVCVNMPGSCYGSIGPLDNNPQTGHHFYYDFPLFTTRDMIRAYDHLRASLGIHKIFAGLGGSMGGQQLLEWAIEQPDLFDHIIPLATNAHHSPWGIAFNATQRAAIMLDKSWGERKPIAGMEGMRVARAQALLSYRHYRTYWQQQQGITAESEQLPVDQQQFRAETYQHHQGEKLYQRFNAFSYYFLSKAMDTHDVGRGRGGAEKALAAIKARTLVLSLSSDILFPPEEQQFLADHIPGAKFQSIESQSGHDGFLLEADKIEAAVSAFLTEKINPAEKSAEEFLLERG